MLAGTCFILLKRDLVRRWEFRLVRILIIVGNWFHSKALISLQVHGCNISVLYHYRVCKGGCKPHKIFGKTFERKFLHAV